MTREEANRIVSDPKYRMTETGIVDLDAALGMLKLEELEWRINLALNTEIFSNRDGACAKNIKTALDRAGLQIIEK